MLLSLEVGEIMFVRLLLKSSELAPDVTYHCRDTLQSQNPWAFLSPGHRQDGS